MKNLSLIAVVLLCLCLSCEKDIETKPTVTETTTTEEGEVIASLEYNHAKMQEDFLNNRVSFDETCNKDILEAEAYSLNEIENTSELKVAPAVSMVLAWWFTESCNWLYGQGLDKKFGHIFEDAAESNEDYTGLLNNVPNMVKIKDGDALMIKAKLDAQRFKYINCASKLEDALSHYLAALPNSAAHIFPCLKAIETAYQKASIENGSHNLKLFSKYSTWAYDCYRLAYNKMKNSNYKQIENVIKKAGGKYSGTTGLKSILAKSSGYWQPVKKNVFRSLPNRAKRCQFQIHDYKRNDLRMHNKSLIREGAHYKATNDTRLNYCQIKRDWQNHYQFVWKDDRNKPMGLYYKRYKAKFGKKYQTNNWLEMTHNKANSFIWALIPYGREKFMLVHKDGKVFGGEFNSKCFLNNEVNSNNKGIILSIP
ncbi:MAG: hypothetical protein MI922_19045 [Bacteroidales bacterium]|nr:hypothetical protein [Bacteroidales bacterium]